MSDTRRNYRMEGEVEALRVLLSIVMSNFTDDPAIRRTTAGEVIAARNEAQRSPEGILRQRQALQSFVDELDDFLPSILGDE